MPTYTVHEPHPLADTLDERATRLVFVKEGFAWLGFLVPLIWLLYNRLWREVLILIVIFAASMALVSYAGGNTTASGWVMLLINIVFGFEARNIFRRALARKGYEVIGVVTGRDLEDSERRFLSEWLPTAKSATPPSAPATPTGSSSGANDAMPMIGARMAAG